MARHPRQRGTVYVLVLGITAMLVVLGVAGAILARSTAERHTLEHDQARAAVLAESYLDLVHARLDGTTTWRSTHSNDTWSTPAEALAGGQVQYKLVDRLDGSLVDENAQPVTLYARATVGRAVRVYRIDLTSYDGSTLERDWSTFKRVSDE